MPLTKEVCLLDLELKRQQSNTNTNQTDFTETHHLPCGVHQWEE